MSKTIAIKCKGNRYISHSELKTFQGNLKEMTKDNARKLRASILKHGWVAPVFVWNKKEILDGHGRLLVLAELLEEGYTIDKLPVVDIEAKTKKEAAEILLAINSKYQSVTEEGLQEFMFNMDLSMDDLADIELPDIDFEHFKSNFFSENLPGDKEPEKTYNCECLKCGKKHNRE